MLSEETKKRIEAEEQFRHDLKVKLEAELASARSAFASLHKEAEQVEKRTASKVMEFLNSSVGTWFLSSVVITGGPLCSSKFSIVTRLNKKIKHS
jgi:predicted  nucleic acid-binding Zn-ribbon protein